MAGLVGDLKCWKALVTHQHQPRPLRATLLYVARSLSLNCSPYNAPLLADWQRGRCESHCALFAETKKKDQMPQDCR